MNWFESLITAILKWITSQAKVDSISEDSKPNEILKTQLQDRIDLEHKRLFKPRNLRPERPACPTCGEREGTCLCSR